jgi:hypothetical protein
VAKAVSLRRRHRRKTGVTLSDAGRLCGHLVDAGGHPILPLRGSICRTQAVNVLIVCVEV